MADPFQIALRNTITGVLNKQAEKVYEHNLELFYSLDLELIRNMELNQEIRRYFNSASFTHIMDLYQNTLPDIRVLKTPSQIKSLVDKYLHQDFDADEDPNQIYAFIHHIFYRLYIKGGSAIKTIVEYIFYEKMANMDEVIPSEISTPTDIDSNLVMNPLLNEPLEFEKVLLTALGKSLEKIMTEQRVKYVVVQWILASSLNKMPALLKDVQTYYRSAVPIKFVRTHEEPVYKTPLGPVNYYMKPDRNALKLFYQQLPGIKLFRLLIDVAITTEDGRKVDNTAGEIIDIAYYDITNEHVQKAWYFACGAHMLSNPITLFMNFGDIISDLNFLIGATDSISISKREKRAVRRNFLVFSYCVYKMFREHFESNRTIEYQNIQKYCPSYVDKMLRSFVMENKAELVPFLLGNRDKTYPEIILNTLESIFMKEDYRGVEYLEGAVAFKKGHFISADQYNQMIEKVSRIIGRLPTFKQLQFFSTVVSIYMKSIECGDMSYLFFLCIMEEVPGNPDTFINRIVERFYQMKNRILEENQSTVFQSHNLAVQIIEQLNRDHRQLQMDMLLITRTVPHQLIIQQNKRELVLIIYEAIAEKIKSFYKVPVIIQLINRPYLAIAVSLVVPINKTINTRVYRGEVYQCILVVSWQNGIPTVKKGLEITYRQDNKILFGEKTR